MLIDHGFADQKRHVRQLPGLQVGEVIDCLVIEPGIILPFFEVCKRVVPPEITPITSLSPAEIVTFPGHTMLIEQIHDCWPIQRCAIAHVPRNATACTRPERNTVGVTWTKHRAEIVAT